MSLAQPQDYVEALRAAFVLVDPHERRARIVAEVEAAAARAGGSARITDDNLEQVVNLVECRRRCCAASNVRSWQCRRKR